MTGKTTRFPDVPRRADFRWYVRLAAAVLAFSGPGPSELEAGGTGFPLIDSFAAGEVGADVIGLRAVQDANGTLYFGSNSLLVFDGDRWRSHAAGGSYGLYGLDFGPDGRLWAGGVGEIGWFSRRPGSWEFVSLRDKLEPGIEVGDIWHAFAFGTGAVFAANDRLLYWDGVTLRTWSMPDTRRVRAFRVDQDVFIQHELTGLYLMRGDGPQLVAAAELIGVAAIFGVERDGDGLLLLTTNGLMRITSGKRVAIEGSATDFIRNHRPTTVVRLRDGRLAVGTMDDGIAIVSRDGRLDAVINESSGFNSTYILPLLCDRDGDLWVGSRGAIVRISVESRSTVFDRRANFPRQPAVKLGRFGGRLVLANAQGIYTLDETSRQFSWSAFAGGGLYDFHADSKGLLIAGYRGVKRLAGGQVTISHATTGDVSALTPSQRNPDHVLFAEGGRILDLPPTGPAHVVAEGLPDVANSIAEDADGTLWLGTKAYGLFLSDQSATRNGISRADEKLGLANPRGDCRVIATVDHTIVVFNPLGAWVRDRATRRFTPITGAPRRAVTFVAAAANGSNLWAVYKGENGRPPIVARISVGATGASWEPHAVEGLASIGVPRSVFAESVGGATVLWIGGTEGVLRHEFTGAPDVPTPRAPVIRGLARSSHAPAGQILASIPLPASTPSVELEFSVPEFGRRSSLTLETWIEGIDGGWTVVGTGSRRELNAIRAGSYNVRARAVAESGRASSETVLTFQVLKPWWQTTPAIASLGLACVFLASGVYQLRVRALRRRNADLEHKVRERTQQLERASAAKTEFVANMSHDIRNPLNGIVGLAIALEDTRLNGAQREMVATLRECTTYLSSLVDDVLDFASIEAGRVELRPGAFNAGELLRSIVTTLKTDAIQSGATLALAVDPELPSHLMGDAGRIQQILVNFVSNALKYAGGDIVISVHAPAHAAGEIEFAVSDRGPGLSDADQATLFTKFSRSREARQLNVPGAGLGLAACRLLADIMGGSVGVVSTLGKGARFFVRLPLAVATPSAVEPAGALPNSTVLLVEDTDYNAWAATAVLARLGLHCERARNGAEALQLFGEKRFNVVLLDRNLPDMDGTEVARRMRKMEGDGLPSIMLAITAYCTAGDRLRCIEAGMDAFVGKPLTPEKLRKVLIAAGRRMLASASVDLPADATPATPPGQTSDSASGIDATLLRYLGDDDDEGLHRQIQRFVATLQHGEEKLLAAATKRDCNAIASIAHSLLGHARMVGSTGLADAATALEDAAQRADVHSCAALMDAVRSEIARVKAALHHHQTGQRA